MGFIKILSRQGEHPDLIHQILNDLDDEHLPGLMVGDAVTFQIDIDEDAYLRLIEQAQDGFCIRRKPPMPYTDEPEYVAEIQFRIKQRSHTLTRVRGDDATGFRTYGVTVCLEAISDAGEALFIALEPDFSSP